MSFTIFDTETTGFAIGADDRLIEIGAVHVENFEVTDRTFQTFVNPLRKIPDNIKKLTSIEQHHVDTAPSALKAIESYFQYIEHNKSAGWIGHHISFDETVIKKELGREKYSYEQPSSFDTMDLINHLNPHGDQLDLEAYAKEYGTKIFERHRALGDALTTAYLFVEILNRLESENITTLADLIRVRNRQTQKYASQF